MYLCENDSKLEISESDPVCPQVVYCHVMTYILSKYGHTLMSSPFHRGLAEVVIL